jgi:biotin carboxyl carrier protein
MNTIKHIAVFAVSLVLAAGVIGCSGGENSGHSGHDHEQPHDAGPTSPNSPDSGNRTMEVPPTVRDNLGITFASVERRNVASTIRVPGAFELHPLARHAYHMMLPGQVQLKVDQYDTVKPGETLYRFRSPNWSELRKGIVSATQHITTAKAKKRVEQATLEEIRTQYRTVRERIKALDDVDMSRAKLESNAAKLNAQIETQKANVASANTELENARRALDHALNKAASAIGRDPSYLTEPVTQNETTVPRYQSLNWIEVPARKPGVVRSLEVTDGSFVEAGTGVLKTVDPSRVRFRANGLQSDLSKFTRSQQARIVPPQRPGTDVNDALPADLSLGLDADPDQRTIPLVAIPDGQRSWARPGVSAYLEVVTGRTNGKALAIPKSAIVRDGITDVYFRRDRNNPNRVVRVEADLGVEDGRWVEVKSGLGPDDEVVVDGAYELMLATKKSGNTQKGGHFHSDGSFHAED